MRVSPGINPSGACWELTPLHSSSPWHVENYRRLKNAARILLLRAPVTYAAFISYVCSGCALQMFPAEGCVPCPNRGVQMVPLVFVETQLALRKHL